MSGERLRAVEEVQAENEGVKVTKYVFAPGATTGWHRHARDYVIVPLTSGKLKLTNGAGESVVAELVQGQSYFRKAGVEHDVENANDFEFAFVEVEIK
ncbi:MAG TPA: cupin domain-containing protein [Alphaproteobacteria bacterium]